MSVLIKGGRIITTAADYLGVVYVDNGQIPAKLFGLYPRKGTIAPSSDADIVVFDPEKRHLITAATLQSRSDYNLYEGTEVTGSPEVVLLRGNVLVDNGVLVADPGVGQFVERAAFGQELLPAAAR